MYSDAARRLLAEPNPAALATVNADGSPQTSVVWVGLDGDDLVISTAEGRLKERNARREPRVSLIVHDPADPLRYVEVRGTAVVEPDLDRALAVRLAEQYEGAGAGEEYLELPPEVIRVVIRISPTRVRSNAKK